MEDEIERMTEGACRKQQKLKPIQNLSAFHNPDKILGKIMRIMDIYNIFVYMLCMLF